jgi:3-hydroxy-9,10-secoandrosta-1,3,5(10)-triene-9,17-dione monooxygenase reductase component
MDGAAGRIAASSPAMARSRSSTTSATSNALADSHQEISAAFAVSGGDKFSGVSWSTSANGSPVLEDVVAWIDCRLYAEHRGGDHSIVVGAVEDMGASSAGQPLLYFRGGYATLGG